MACFNVLGQIKSVDATRERHRTQRNNAKDGEEWKKTDYSSLDFMRGLLEVHHLKWLNIPHADPELCPTFFPILLPRVNQTCKNMQPCKYVLHVVAASLFDRTLPTLNTSLYLNVAAFLYTSHQTWWSFTNVKQKQIPNACTHHLSGCVLIMLI